MLRDTQLCNTWESSTHTYTLSHTHTHMHACMHTHTHTNTITLTSFQSGTTWFDMVKLDQCAFKTGLNWNDLLYNWLMVSNWVDPVYNWLHWVDLVYDSVELVQNTIGWSGLRVGQPVLNMGQPGLKLAWPAMNLSWAGLMGALWLQAYLTLNCSLSDSLRMLVTNRNPPGCWHFFP